MHFEEMISYSCKKYYEEGKLYMWNPSMQKTAQSDYKGTLAGGVGIMFDAKHTSTNMIKQNAVTNKQFEDFNLCHDLGVKCFVLVSVRFESFYRIPWSVWKNMENLFGHKYMTLEELQPYKIRATLGGIFFLDDISTMDDSAAGE